VRDAHSLYLETAAELGLVGLALLLALAGSVAVAARRAAPAAAGPVAVLAAYGLHAGVDWDWELPALTLVALVLAGLVLARSAARSAAPDARAP
jgi:O-antigen ligase